MFPFPLLNNLELSKLKEALLFLHVSELKKWLQQFNLTDNGKKMLLIERLIYLKTGPMQIIE